MERLMEQRDSHSATDPRYVDAVVVGAGFSGLFATWRLTQLGLSVRAFDLGSEIGGVWTWNRYPGAQTDSPHHTYRYTFDERLLSDWRYSKKFPPGNEVREYLNHVADRFGLRQYYTLNTRIESATFDDARSLWEIRTDGGETVLAKYFVTGVGLVSEPVRPNYSGLDTFGGELYYTSNWPQTPVDLAGKRVALIGTGSSGTQISGWIADNAAEMTVYLRTPNYVAPTGNREVTDEDQRELRDGFERVRAQMRAHPASFPFELSQGRLAVDATPEELDAVFEEMWNRGGFSLLYESFDDVSTDKRANDLLGDFFRRKIAEIVTDPVKAAVLSPHYPYGSKRPPTGDAFYQSFNKDHVGLVDVRATPITEVTERGIVTGGELREFDVIILATGFDASTGAFTRMNITGRDGISLAEHWANGPRTFAGVAVHGFPNMFMVAGPQSPFSNLPPGAELAGNWIGDCIEWMRENDVDRVEATAAAEADWVQLCNDIAADSFALAAAADANSWFAGANIEGKPRAINIYFGGANAYADKLEGEASSNYESFEITSNVSLS
jgi:cation diffusion facilitator CzcD-associated flavoprotein CzcO